ncbi:MAG: hypothetical protein ACRDTG_20095, partial [Pseudonocardiaceae bacterium]
MTLRRKVALSVAAVATAGATVAVAAPVAGAAQVPPEHAIIVCQSATFYDNVPSSGGNAIRVLPYGDKVGHT